MSAVLSRVDLARLVRANPGTQIRYLVAKRVTAQAQFGDTAAGLVEWTVRPYAEMRTGTRYFGQFIRHGSLQAAYEHAQRLAYAGGTRRR